MVRDFDREKPAINHKIGFNVNYTKYIFQTAIKETSAVNLVDELLICGSRSGLHSSSVIGCNSLCNKYFFFSFHGLINWSTYISIFCIQGKVAPLNICDFFVLCTTVTYFCTTHLHSLMFDYCYFSNPIFSTTTS